MKLPDSMISDELGENGVVAGDQFATNPFSSRHTRPGAIPFQTLSKRNSAAPLIETIIGRLQAARSGVIVGKHGTGKSTLLHCLSPSLQSAMPGGRWVQLTRQSDSSWLSRFQQWRDNIHCVALAESQTIAGGVLVIDGAEQLPSWFRRLLLRKTRISNHYCLMTAHRDLRACETVYRTSICPELLQDLFDQLVFNCDAKLESSQRLRRRFGQIDLSKVDNVRSLWAELYDVVEEEQRMTENRMIAGKITT